MEALTPGELELLKGVAEWHYASMDLRFEGGTHVAALDGLARRGLVRWSEGSEPYMVSYVLTDQGKRVLAAQRGP